MKYSLFISILTVLVVIVVFTGCSDFYTYEPIRIEMLSLENGDILKKNDDVYFKIIVDEGESSPQALTIDLKNRSGRVMASNTLSSPEINTEIVLNDLINDALDIAHGEYSLAFTISSKEEIIAQAEWVFFYVDESFQINGVWSYPWLLQPKDKALLIADLKTTSSLDPYIRWSQDGVVIAKGLLSNGLDQILWETPPREGVYSITVEFFPFAPAGNLDYSFNSKTTMSAELYVSSPVKNTNATIKTDNIFYTLFDMYLYSKAHPATISRSLSQTPIMKPKIVLNGDIIGFKLDGKSGFVCDKLIIPTKNNGIQSFNITLGITPQAVQISKTIFYLYSENGTFSLRCFFDADQNIVVLLTADGVTSTFASGIGTLTIGERYVIDFSLVFKADILKAVWKLNGQQVSAIQNNFFIKKISNSGTSIVGGNNGFTGIIDMLDVVVIEDNDVGSLAPESKPMIAKRLK